MRYVFSSLPQDFVSDFLKLFLIVFFLRFFPFPELFVSIGIILFHEVLGIFLLLGAPPLKLLCSPLYPTSLRYRLCLVFSTKNCVPSPSFFKAPFWLFLDSPSTPVFLAPQLGISIFLSLHASFNALSLLRALSDVSSLASSPVLHLFFPRSLYPFFFHLILFN